MDKLNKLKGKLSKLESKCFNTRHKILKLEDTNLATMPTRAKVSNLYQGNSIFYTPTEDGVDSIIKQAEYLVNLYADTHPFPTDFMYLTGRGGAEVLTNNKVRISGPLLYKSDPLNIIYLPQLDICERGIPKMPGTDNLISSYEIYVFYKGFPILKAVPHVEIKEK